MNRLKREIHYIYWKKDSKLVYLTQEEFAYKVRSLEIQGLTRIGYNTLTSAYIQGKTYSVKKEHDYYILYLRENNEFIRYTTNSFDNNKNTQDTKGGFAISIVNSKFKELSNTTMKSAFDTVEEEFKRCIPKQFYYLSKQHLNKALKMSSIDSSSHYPANMRGRLPDAHTMIKVEGTVKPNEEYPFAFYLNSGHCAEYEVFDTHNWFNYGDKLWQRLFRFSPKENWHFNNINEEDDVTILMKASPYELTDVIDYFYHIKETYDESTQEYQDAKLVMNAFIGMLHEKVYNKYKYAHLVAICIARGNQKILDQAVKIGLHKIAHICVDGIIYTGEEQYGINEKKLGEYFQEFRGAFGKISSINRYIFMKGDDIIKAKWSGVNRVNGKTITNDTITSLDSQYDWYKVDPLKELIYEEKLQKE